MSRLVDVPPQRVYGSIPLALPLIKMSEAEAIWMHGQPQIYDKDYPLDYSGLNLDPPWWADTGVGGGLSGVGGGNIKLLPGENAFGFGFGAFGLTAAQQANQAAAAARKQAAANRQATAQAAATARQKAASDKAAAAQAAKQTAAAAKQATAQANAATKAAAKTATAANRQQVTCANKGGTWDSTALKCTLPLTKAQQTSADMTACMNSGGVWDKKNKVCGTAPAPTAGSQNCPTGQTWDTVQGQCLPGTTSVGTPDTHPNCAAVGGTWDGTNCNPPPPGVSNPQVTPQAQCQQSGGYWNGYSCGPQPQQYPPVGGGSGGGGIAPIPPGFDSGSGDMGGGAPPPGYAPGMPTGGGMPMTQGYGPGPQIDEQAMMIPTAEPEDDKKEDTGSTEDADKVASTNIFESISKLFSGMNGLNEGTRAMTPWFGMGRGGNVPTHDDVQRYFSAQNVDPVRPSTTTAVIGGALVLMVGAAAVFLWSKGNKK